MDSEEVREDEQEAPEPVQQVTCSGGIRLPSLSVVVGEQPVPEAFKRKAD